MRKGLQEFTEMVTKELRHLLPDCKVQAGDVDKNNGVILKGITIQNEESVIAPNIYIDSYYAEYKNGRTLKSICEEIVRLYYREKNPIIMGLDVSQIMDFDAIKDRICFRLVNYQKNECALQTMPHRKFLDLAIIYSVAVTLDGAEGSIKVTDSLLEHWNVCEQTLYEMALQNTENYNKWMVVPMRDILLRFIIGENDYVLDDAYEDMIQNLNLPLYVVSNTQKIFGATVLLYTEMFRKISRSLGNCNLYIIPSSVHELIVLEETTEFEAEQLIQTVRDVNCTDVEPEEVLGENLYFYDARNNQVVLLTA